MRISAILAALPMLLSFAFADSRPSVNAQQLVSEVVQNELNADKNDQSNWMYIDEAQEKGRVETKRVVESKDGDISRLIAINGKPLSPEEQKKEDQRVARLVNDQDKLAKQRKDGQEDGNKAREMLHMIRDAFLFTQDGQEGQFVRLKFVPNPKFDPPTREARVLHAMAGTMLVDAKEKRLAGLQGKMVSDVDFGFGILGHLNKGGTFALKRAEVAPGHWESTLIDVHLNGKALLFKSINEQQHEVRSNFKQVPQMDARRAAQELDRNADWGQMRASAQ
jgi:hypothetical protein